MAASAVVVAGLLAVSAGASLAKPQPELASVSFIGPMTCIYVGQSDFFPPLTAQSTSTSRVNDAGELTGCTGNVTQHGWTITGGVVVPFGPQPSVPGTCNGINGVAMKSSVYWKATPSGGALAADFPPVTKISFPAPLTSQIGGSYVESWSSDIHIAGSFHTTSGSQTLTISPSVSELTSQCTLPADAEPGISYATVGGTISF